MALLELQGIGKIYVSEGAVAVGIRGVDLSFDKGEFVAITGQSGSGKSTLLNVISGMDTYEEGEMYVEGEATSHYVQADWEKYREKYISFIFQDYNIIDSFTVLENVELSLLHIRDAKERRRRAMELIERVGLKDYTKHRGSHLSGGQKQRTVIARALAKDSPIILADEPTGNLDAESSKEIVQLLREVSRDKLLIVVTHNFEEVEQYATREIRVFDGAIAADRKLEGSEPIAESTLTPIPQEETHSALRNSSLLGWSIFKAMPRLTTFLCFLLLLATGVIFMGFCLFWGDIKNLMNPETGAFSYENGRVIVTRQDGGAVSTEELEKLMTETGAKRAVHNDALWDVASIDDWRYFVMSFVERGEKTGDALRVVSTEDRDFTPSIGRLPEKPGECMLSIPRFMKSEWNQEFIDNGGTITNFYLLSGTYPVTVVGIRYYADTSVMGEIVLCPEEYRQMADISAMTNCSGLMPAVEDEDMTIISMVTLNHTIEPGIVAYHKKESKHELEKATGEVGVYLKPMDESLQTMDETKISYIGRKIESIKECKYVENGSWLGGYFAINPSEVADLYAEIVEKTYSQGSLFYSSDRAAEKQLDVLREKGYIAAMSSASRKMSMGDLVSVIVLGVISLLMWMGVMIFMAFFVRICTQKSVEAFRGDIAIMRSMGIRVKEIKMAVYIRMLLCMVPALIVLPFFVNWIYQTPFGGSALVYLHGPEYVFIILGLIWMVWRITGRQAKALFSESVKKNLKGGEKE